MRLVDLSALIAQSPAGTPPFDRTDIAYSNHVGSAAQAQAILKVPLSEFRHDEGWATEEFTKFGTPIPRTSTRPGTTTARSTGSPRRLSKNCHWNGSMAMAWCWTCATKPMARR